MWDDRPSKIVFQLSIKLLFQLSQSYTRQILVNLIVITPLLLQVPYFVVLVPFHLGLGRSPMRIKALSFLILEFIGPLIQSLD